MRYTRYCSYGARVFKVLARKWLYKGALVLYSSWAPDTTKADCHTDKFFKTNPRKCGKLLSSNITMPSR